MAKQIINELNFFPKKNTNNMQDTAKNVNKTKTISLNSKRKNIKNINIINIDNIKSKESKNNFSSKAKDAKKENKALLFLWIFLIYNKLFIIKLINIIL